MKINSCSIPLLHFTSVSFLSRANFQSVKLISLFSNLPKTSIKRQPCKYETFFFNDQRARAIVSGPKKRQTGRG
ncbi:hypothetical protein Peur_038438 [Populus x canadensis]